MDYFQGVVAEYLRADRSRFVNPECRIELSPGKRGRHWFCDILAVDFRTKHVFLCEVTYSRSLSAITKRLTEWSENWSDVRKALARDCSLPADWPVVPWLFVPHDLRELLDKKLTKLTFVGKSAGNMPAPMITDLEDVTPWNVNSPAASRRQAAKQ